VIIRSTIIYSINKATYQISLSLVEQELTTLPEHPSSHPNF